MLRIFETDEQLASWCGLTPKFLNPQINCYRQYNKTGFKACETDAGSSCSCYIKSKNSKLKRFFLHILARKERKKPSLH